MKKLLLGCILLITACQTATPTPEPSFFPTETPPPTPIPDTPTPEPTFTPEPTQTPLPRFFTTQFDPSIAGWVILQGGNESVPNISTENNALRMQMDSPYTFLYALYGAEDYMNVRIETTFVNAALSPASIGLICRYSEEDGWLEYNISTDGTYNVLYGKWLANGIVEYQPIIDGGSNEIGISGESQKIGLVCLDTTLQLYVNETLIRNIDIAHIEYTDGKVGLAAASFENTPVVASFSSVAVSEP